MSDDWLDAGHGDGGSLIPVSSTAPPAAHVAGGPAEGSWRSRFASPLVVAVVAAIVLFASAGTVFAIRETIFPSIGAPTSRSVWQNPSPADEPAAIVATSSTVSTSTTSTSSTVPTSSTSIVPATSSSPPPTSEQSTVPTVSIDDNSGSGSDNSGSDDPDNSGRGSDDSGSDNSGSGSDDSGSGSGSD